MKTDIEIAHSIQLEKISEIAKKIQDNVKTTVETMTGLEVTLVNVYIQGVTTKHEKNIETK